ncbi:MAG TPA: copper homeostasis protein CutC, partial [Saprospiraceae bacterium]|nr:copper homeostasis protein CutC [Saprospiraceae bacterium]
MLELACFSLNDALIAAQKGIGRIEFCKDYHTGGLTPSVEEVAEIKAHYPDLPVFVMIRPREGDFFYEGVFDKDQIRNLMKEYIEIKVD